MTDFDFPHRIEAKRIGSKGASFVQNYLIQTFGWEFRPVHLEVDFGIDGYVDIIENGKATGKSIAVQIKCGKSFWKEETIGGYKFQGENKHLNYYLNFSIPIVFVILSEDCKTGLWVDFKIEKTSPTRDGWWIEVPSKNILTASAKQEWLKLVGPIRNFTEKIREEWVIDKRIQESHYCVFSIPKKDILGLKLDQLEIAISRLSKNREMLLSKHSSMEIFFPEYDGDPREIFQIPEIRKWFEFSVTMKFPWFYFLEKENSYMGLELLLYCTCPIVTETKDSKGFNLGIDGEQIQKYLEDNFQNLNEFIEGKSIPEELNRSISSGIENFMKTKILRQ